MSLSRTFRASLLWAIGVLGLLLTALTRADETVPAVSVLFEEEVLTDNVLAVLKRTRGLSETERFEPLVQWVFPASGRTVRVGGALVCSNLEPGHNVQSPVFELLDIAKTTGRMEELADRISTLEASKSVRTETQQRSLLALKALVFLAANDTSAADTAILRLTELVRQAPPMAARDKWPELLVASRGVMRYPSQETIHDLIGLLRELQNQHPPQGDDEATRSLVSSLMGQMHWQTKWGGKADEGLATIIPDWIPATGTASRAGGTGLAVLDWRRNPQNEIDHVSGHLDDFLLYAVPLRGDFEITGDIAGYHQTQLFLNGQILGAANEYQRAAGIFRSGVIPHPIDPPLQWPSHWVRFRAKFTGDRRQLFLNGRLVSDEPLKQPQIPWVGFHGYWWTAAAVRHVQVSGSPVIPSTVSMSESVTLDDWRSYSHQSVGFENANWRCAPDAEGKHQIIGGQATEFAGTPYESLLHYVRPLRDGDEVEYDSFCDETTELAHPAVGTQAFVIRPEGIMRHEVTAGEFEQRELSPDNLSPLDSRAINVKAPPLKRGEWNHVMIAREGDVATLTLNGTRVASLPVPAVCHFGLFHFSDRSEARVRNVQMRGRWPTELPALPEQSLADLTTSRLDQRVPELTAAFSHDFICDGFLSPLVRVPPIQIVNFKPQKSGLAATCQSTGPWQLTELSTGVELHGDFDVEVAFENLHCVGTGWSGITMNVDFDDTSRHTTRAMFAKDPAGACPMLQASLSEQRNGEVLYDHFDLVDCESSAGRLRLSRRGDVVHYLFAEGDSPTFRSFGERNVSTSPTKANGITLQINCHAGAQCGVTWKKLSARAERIVEHPVSLRLSLEELDQSRDQLTSVYKYDFAVEGFNTDRLLSLYEDPNGIRKVANGLMVSKTGQGGWTFGQIFARTQFTGNFDLEVEFEDLQLTGKEQAYLILAANLIDDEGSSFRLIRERNDKQEQTVYSQRLRERWGGKYENSEILPNTTDRGRLRIARRGKEICFLIAGDDGPYQMVSQQPCSESASTTLGVKLECLVNGTAKSSVVWKTLTLRAENVDR